MTERAAGYVIFRKIANSIEYLLLQASYPDFHWSPPKGHVELGECDDEAAIREVEEESGFKKCDLNIIIGFQKILNYIAKGTPKTVVYGLAELKNPSQKVILSGEHKDFKWLPLEEACLICIYKETEELLRACHEHISKYPK
ncbi:hypothetical protein PGB90_000421 [Kerria lacca]